ncbi:ATP-binding cassette domain-containing protein [Streptomyces zhihengii]
MLELRDVARSYGGVPVLGPVGLTVHKGRCVVVTGGNGSGKSTLLRLAAGRERPTKGTVRLDGAEMDGDRRQVRSAVATVIDTDAFYPDLTVREHLMLVALAHGGGGAAPETVSAALAAHHLTDRAEVPPSALSSGQRQQMLLAAAFVRPHRLLILDEPEQRLDAGARGSSPRAWCATRPTASPSSWPPTTPRWWRRSPTGWCAWGTMARRTRRTRRVRRGRGGRRGGEASGGDDADRGGGGREAAAGDRG